MAFQREYELLDDAMIIRRFDKSRFPPGGANGTGGRFVVRPGAKDEIETRASGRYDLKAGDRFLIQSAGGGGFGDPRERSAEAVAKDVAEGYVSRAAARKIYQKEP